MIAEIVHHMVKALHIPPQQMQLSQPARMRQSGALASCGHIFKQGTPEVHDGRLCEQWWSWLLSAASEELLPVNICSLYCTCEMSLVARCKRACSAQPRAQEETVLGEDPHPFCPGGIRTGPRTLPSETFLLLCSCQSCHPIDRIQQMWDPSRGMTKIVDGNRAWSLPELRLSCCQHPLKAREAILSVPRGLQM